MKKLERYIVRNWIWFISGCILTKLAVGYAYTERGYMAFGGEWLVLPITLMVAEICREMYWFIIELAEMEEEDEAELAGSCRGVQK